MAFYFIDYENVRIDGLNGISKLTESDNVYIFYSENADTLTFGLARRLRETNADVHYQKIEVGTKNALDFQLSSYLGYIINGNKDNNDITYYIITNDSGFKVLETYWRRHKYNVKIVQDCTGKENTNLKNAHSNNTKDDKSNNNDELVHQIEKLTGCTDISPKVAEIIRKYKNKQNIHNNLIKEFNREKGSSIYNKVKSLINS